MSNKNNFTYPSAYIENDKRLQITLIRRSNMFAEKILFIVYDNDGTILDAHVMNVNEVFNT